MLGISHSWRLIILCVYDVLGCFFFFSSVPGSCLYIVHLNPALSAIYTASSRTMTIQSSKYRITFYSLFTLYLYLISRSFMLFCCLALVYSVSPLSSPRIFSTSTSSFLLPPTSTSLLPHFNPPNLLLSPPRPSLLAFICWH